MNKSKAIFIGALVALPVPFLVIFLAGTLNLVGSDVSFTGLLSSEASVGYYALTWALVVVAMIVTLALSGTEKSSNGFDSLEGKEDQADVVQGSDFGSVKWFNVNKGYGFITTDSGDDIFVHFRSIQGKGRRVLRQGQKVCFDITDGDKGKQAENVSAVS